jgi:3-phosphoshikimate 1-carboxyvinyltransferase
MNLIAHPSDLSGRIEAPGSKSHMQRLLAAGLLAKGESWIRRPSDAADCMAAAEVAAGLGADIEIGQEALRMRGGLSPRTDALHMGESGLGIRLFSPIAALASTPLKLTGGGTLQKRPMQPMADALSALGASARLTDGRLPIELHGPLKGGTTTLDGSISSQFLTGLLMALPCAKADSVLEVTDLKSRPYVDMTLEVLNATGIAIHHEDYQRFSIPGGQTYQPFDETIAGDWSAGAFLLILAALCGEPFLEVDGLGNQPTQADQAVTGALLLSGAKLMRTDTGIRVERGRRKGFRFDATHCPDLFPPLAAFAAFCKGPTVLTGLHRLEHKESNRGTALQEEFAKAGIQIDLNTEEDTLTVRPGPIQAATLNGRGDHRMVMAAAVLGLAGAPIEIEGVEAVAKSYPDFFDALSEVGARFGKA